MEAGNGAAASALPEDWTAGTFLGRIATTEGPSPALLVRGTLFDKNPDANWSLFWHQDSIITVKERVDAPGYSC